MADVLTSPNYREAAIVALAGPTFVTFSDCELWLEAQPISPRKGEGNSQIDLALGSIMGRPPTTIGLQPAPSGGHVCFAEAKVLSDCSTTVTNDLARNQLARVIENLLTFQCGELTPSAIVFTLLTPRFFRDVAPQSRLYGYTYRDYQTEPASVLEDIQRSTIAQRSDRGWRYPELDRRLEALTFHWASYEDVFALDPDLAEVDVVDVASRGALPEAIASRMREAAARLQVLQD